MDETNKTTDNANTQTNRVMQLVILTGGVDLDPRDGQKGRYIQHQPLVPTTTETNRLMPTQYSYQ